MKRLLLFVSILLLVGCVSAQIPMAQPPWCGITNLFFTDVASDTTPFHQLTNYAVGLPEKDENVTISSASGIVLLDSYYSNPGFPGSQGLLSGLRFYTLWGYVSNTGGSSAFVINTTVRHKDGSSTYLYGFVTNSIEYLTPAQVTTPYVSGTSLEFNSTDRILINISAYTTSVSPKTIHFLSEGTMHYSWVQSGDFVCGNTQESYAYSPSKATPLTEWIVVALTAIALFICAFYLRLRNEDGEISKERTIFSIVASVVCGLAAYLSLEIIIPSGGLATSVVYQLPVIAILFVILSVLAFANFIYCIVQKDMVKPDKKDYKNDNGERE